MIFTKMHGLGNDFIVTNNLEGQLTEARLPEIARKCCDRHFGIGGDGLITVEPSDKAHFRMRIFNSDGSEPEMCGNGIRCFAKYVFDNGIHKEPVMEVETLAGVLELSLTVEDGRAKDVRVYMGEPILERSRIPMSGGGNGQAIGEKLEAVGQTFEFTAVSMGNPHCVIFVDNVAEYPVGQHGPEIEKHPAFPQRTNVEFVETISRDTLKMRVWERGAGMTLACGTGACATAVAGVLNGISDRTVTVQLPGGDLLIEWAEDNRIYMTGPAEEVFVGEIAL